MKSRAETYWLLTAPESRARPPCKAALDGDRRAAVAALRGDLHPQLFQGLQKIVQGPLAEAFAAGEDVSALPQGGKRRKKAHGGAGVAQVDGLRHRPPVAADAPDPDGSALPVDARPQLRQGLGGEFGVFGPEGVAQQAFPGGQAAATKARWV